MKTQRGFALVQLLVSLGIGSILLSAALVQWSNTHLYANDLAVKGATNTQAAQVAQLLKFELISLGSGIPFELENFRIGTAGLGDAPSPIVTANSDSVVFRNNITGSQATIMADYTPAANSLSFSVDSTDGFSVGDTIYLSNAMRLGDDGMQAQVAGLTSQTITIEAGYLASAGAEFTTGSSVERVTTITYSSSNWDGITRSDELIGTTIDVATNAQVEFAYLDDQANTLAAPLSTAQIRDELAGIQFTVRIRGRKNLSDSTVYEESRTETVSLKNLIASR